MLKITYYGHSCFKVENETQSLLFDPYQDASVPGLQLPKDIQVNEVYCSHGHHDHCASDLIASSHDFKCPVNTIEVPHDDQNGTLRGMNLIHVVDFNGDKVVHFGDLGRPLLEEEAAKLNAADVMMIPVGGYYTIDADTAFDIIHQLKPKLCILMHFRSGEAGYDVLEKLDDILQRHTDVQVLQETSYEYHKEDEPKVIVLSVQK